MGRSLKEWLLWSMDPEALDEEGSWFSGSGGNECCSDIWRSGNVGEWGPDGKQKLPPSCLVEGASCPLYDSTNLVSDLFNFVRRRGPWAAKAREASLPAPTVAGNPEADGTASGEGDDVVVASGGVEEKAAAADKTHAESSPIVRSVIAAARKRAAATAPVAGIAPDTDAGDGAAELSVAVAEAAADEGLAVIRPFVGWRSAAMLDKQTVAAAAPVPDVAPVTKTADSPPPESVAVTKETADEGPAVIRPVVGPRSETALEKEAVAAAPATGVSPATKAADSPPPESVAMTKETEDEGLAVIHPVVGSKSAAALEQQTVATAAPATGVAPVTKAADSPPPVSVAMTKAADTCPAVYTWRVLAIEAPTGLREETVASKGVANTGDFLNPPGGAVVGKQQAADTCPAVYTWRVLAIGAPTGLREETVASKVVANTGDFLNPPGDAVVWKGQIEGPGQLYVQHRGINKSKALPRSNTVRGEKGTLALVVVAGVLLILACRRLKRRWRAEKEEEGEKEGEDGEEEQEEEDMWHDAEDEVWQDVEDEVWEDAKEEKGAEEEEEEALQARRARIVTAPSGQGENIEPASGPSRDQSSKEADKKKTRPPRPARVIHEIRFSAEDKGVLLGDGGLLEFFQDTFPVSFIVDERSSIVRFFGHRSGRTPECARACLEHALWVCREGGYQPSDFVLLRHTLAMPAHGANVGVEGMALAESDFVQKLSSVAETFGCVGHYVGEHMLFLADYPRQPPAARPPPDRRFTPPLFERYKNVGVVQLWGLRHCVLATRSHLGDVLARQTKDVKHVLGIGMDAVHHAEHELRRNGINIPGVTYDSAGGQLRVEGPEATDIAFDELLKWLNAYLPCFGVVSVDSPILMRMLASRRDIAQSVATAGVAGIVNVVATWNPCRLLIWSRNTGRTGVEAVEKLRSVFFRKMARWKSREVSVAVPALVSLFPHARRASDIAQEGDVGTTWPVELARLSNAVGTTLWLDGVRIHGQLASDAPPKHQAHAALVKAVEDLALAHGKQELVPLALYS